jgi:hypothetical protein
MLNLFFVFLLVGDFTQAFKYVDSGLSHTPTAIDFYVLKARIFQHAGDSLSAYHWMDLARRMDTQDRYLNVKTVRYAWRADKVKEAEETVVLFLREGDGLHSLADLQAMWYSLAAGEHFTRQHEFGRALKKFHLIDKHFEDFYEDQFDFHSYCLRKVTLRAYLAMLRWENEIKGHRFFLQAAIQAVKIYLHLYDIPMKKSREEKELAVEMEKMSEEERKEAQKAAKKAAQKERKAAEKAAEKAAQEAAARKAAEAKANKERGVKKNNEAEDKDPDGTEYLKADPLTNATKFVKDLLFHASIPSLSASYSFSSTPSAFEIHLLAVELYLRKEKYLLVYRSLLALFKCHSTHPQVFYARARFLHQYQQAKAAVPCILPPPVQSFLDQQIQQDGMNHSQSLEHSIQQLLQEYSNSFNHKYAGKSIILSLDIHLSPLLCIVEFIDVIYSWSVLRNLYRFYAA